MLSFHVFVDTHPRRSPRSENVQTCGHSAVQMSFPPTSLPCHTSENSPVSSLAATLMNLPASIANERLTAWLSPLDAILTKNRGVTSFKPNIFLSPSASRRSDLQNSGCSSVSQNHPLYFLYLTDPPTQRTLLNSFGINPLCTLFIATEGVPPRN